MYFKTDVGFQNIFLNQPIFNMIKYKNTSTEYATSWKSKGVYHCKLIALNSYYLPNIKYLKTVGFQFDNTPLVVEQNNYTSKIGNIYVIYDLD